MNLRLRWREMNRRQCAGPTTLTLLFGILLVVPCLTQESLTRESLTQESLAQERVTLDEAKEMFRQKRYNEAAAAFASIEKSAPGTSDALLFRGKSLIDMGRFTEAGTALQSYCSQHPESDDGLYLLAYVRFRENKPAESLQLFTQAARLKPPTADDFKIIGLDYALLDDNQSAAKYLQRAVSMQPNSIEARYYLGRALYLQNNFDQCISVFEEVLKQDPTLVKAQDNLALAREGKNQPEMAIAAYRKAIDMDRQSAKRSEQPYLNLATLLIKSGQPREAIPLLKEAQHIRPDSAKVRYELGNAYLGLGQLKDAKTELEESERLDSKDTATHYLLGRLYRRLGETDNAARELKLTEEMIDAKRNASQTTMAR